MMANGKGQKANGGETMRVFRVCGFLAVCVLAMMAVPGAQKRTAPPNSVRVYVFDCGVIKGLDPALFGLKKEEITATEFFVPCYLVAHPKGTLMWDVGVIPDGAFKPDGAPVTQGISTVAKPLKPQLAAAGYSPADITYLGLSHYHSDHTANANDFAGATWLVRQAERDVMFAEKPEGIIQPATYSALKNSKTVIVKDDEYDVFGDGTVVVKSAPGHTPGHQVLFVKLKKTGPILVAGDLYHYPEERTLNRFPSFEFNKEQAAASRAAIDAFLIRTKAELWIEHDAATNAKLKKAPAYYD
jgi:glyoxylase-like metal-dependent hydrolase (beta-lactamase superfamily II)